MGFTLLDLPSPEQSAQLTRLNAKLDTARQALEKRAAELKIDEAAVEKDVLRRFEAHELAWRFERPLTAESTNGATLKIYNDELIEGSALTSGSSLSSEKKPGTWIDRRRRRES